MNERKTWVSKRPSSMSLRSACAVLGVNRSQQYYQRTRSAEKDECDVTLMNEIQDIYAKRPFQGYKRITQDLNDMDYGVNHKRVYPIDATDGITGGVSKEESKQTSFGRYCTSVSSKTTPTPTGA